MLRALQAEKTLERIRAEGLIEKPFVPKSRSFTFPPVSALRACVTCVIKACQLVPCSWSGLCGNLCVHI